MALMTRTDAAITPHWPNCFSTLATRATLAMAMILAPALIALAQETPFQAVVAQDKVDVRAGGSNDFYAVGKLERGARVTVLEILGGWNVIAPPPGVHAIIAKADVTSSDEKTGTVKSEKAIVRALSLKGANATESYRPWPPLKKGDSVEIFGEAGDFYLIDPPKGSMAYLPPGSVRRAEVTAAAPAEVKPAVPAKPVAPPAHVEPKTKTPVLTAKTDAAVTDAAATGAIVPSNEPTKGDSAPKVEPPKTEPVPAVVMDSTTKPAKAAKPPKVAAAPGADGAPATQPKPRGAVFVPIKPPAAAEATTRSSDASVLGDSAQVRELEAKLAAAAKQPIDKRPLTDLIAGYEKADASADLSPTDRKIVSVRLGQLRDNLAVQKAVMNAETVRKNNSAPITLPPPPPPPKPGVYNPADYEAVGQLLASTVYDGDASPRLFRIADSVDQRTIAYVQAGPKVDIQPYLGRIVGVKGEVKYDPALRLRVITADKIDILQVEEPSK